MLSDVLSFVDCCSPEQLILVDDPAFLPDMALPALDFDFSNMILEPAGDSQRSTQSMLSIRKRSGSRSSHSGSGIGIQLPSSSINQGAHQLPPDAPFNGSSAQKAFGGTGHDIFGDEEENLYQDDMLFEFDADGMIRDIDVNEREAHRARAVFPSGQGRPDSDSAASGRVRKEHEDAAAGRLPIIDGEGDFDMVFGDEDHMLPEAEPFPKLASSNQPNHLLIEEKFSQETSSDSAEAPAKRRRPKQKKAIPKDNALELRNGDLLIWQRDYLTHMAIASVAITQKKEAAQAKKNADTWVIGNGLNGVGCGIGSSKLPSPLAAFSGASLLIKITGQPIPSKDSGKKGTKHGLPLEVVDEHAQASASKRARQDDGEGINFDDEVGRGNFDDDIPLHDSSSGVEIGREAPSALADYPSAFMPWNVSTSLHSHQRGSSIAGGRGSAIAGSVGRNMRSASPLIGRGSNIPGELDHFSSQMDEMVQYGRSDNDTLSEIARSKRGESLARGVSSSQAEFEIFGAAAQVDTQTAASSQWMRDALDRESGNFFEYVRNSIEEKTGDQLGHDDTDELDGGREVGKGKFATFEELFEPKQNSRMVAAQAFYHVLSLATKRRVWVVQEGDVMVPFGEIRIGMLA